MKQRAQLQRESRTLDSNPRASGQASLSEILQKKHHTLFCVKVNDKYPLQAVLKDPSKTDLEARLIAQYKQAEKNGDTMFARSDIGAAIANYRRAIELRKRVNKLHHTPDAGHILAIQTLSKKIESLQQPKKKGRRGQILHRLTY